MSPRRKTALRVLAAMAAWAIVAVPVAVGVFANSSRTTVLAGHAATVQPTFDGWATIGLGPVLPSVRYPTAGRLGADIELGPTTLTSYDALLRRYSLLATQPNGQIHKVEHLITDMAVNALVVGALAGLVIPGLWVLVGRERRRELVSRPARSPRATVAGTAGAVAVAALVVAVTRPWDVAGERLPGSSWQTITAAMPEVTIPPLAAKLQIDTGLLTQGTRRLVESGLNSYRTSSEFYSKAAGEAAALAPLIHQPEEDDTVAILVSDRHDNIGMDPVAAAIAEAGQATMLLDAGDDTSSGSSWETFSLESLDDAFPDIEDRFYVAGNHDHGNLITRQAAGLGFTTLDGNVVEGPDGIRLLGVDDPRSSGLGNWRDETGLSFDEVAARLGKAACQADADGERVTTLLVHDANLGKPALEAGCVDLVAAGHLHVIVGPEMTQGSNGRTGYRFTTGSTGGAAYAIAIGTKPRRDAIVSLITYRDGRPIGIQTVSLSPLGDFTVGPYTALMYAASLGPDDSERSATLQ